MTPKAGPSTALWHPHLGSSEASTEDFLELKQGGSRKKGEDYRQRWRRLQSEIGLPGFNFSAPQAGQSWASAPTSLSLKFLIC